MLRGASPGREVRQRRIGDHTLGVDGFPALVVVARAEREGPGLGQPQVELAEEGRVARRFFGVEERSQHEPRGKAGQFPGARGICLQGIGQVGEIEADHPAPPARPRVTEEEFLRDPLVIGRVVQDPGGGGSLVQILGAAVVVLVDAGDGFEGQRVAEVVSEVQGHRVVF